jgi:hypothetical protein
MEKFDWLSDASPLFKAQESWFDGSYQQIVDWQVVPSPDAPFSISCGSGLLAEHIRSFRFSPAVIQRLGQVADKMGRSVFHESFLNHLQRLRLRIQVSMAPEGTLLLPGEPLVIIHGTRIQALLLESAFQMLIWDSTHWATQAALINWGNKIYVEEETPHLSPYPFHAAGWKKRALYIGGGDMALTVPKAPAAWPGMQETAHHGGRPLVQIRRLFAGDRPLADVWLTQVQENQASVGRTHINFSDRATATTSTIQMTRFQNLYQPVLLKGHPVLPGTSVDYLRQRSWKQLEAFQQLEIENYRGGWYSS